MYLLSGLDIRNRELDRGEFVGWRNASAVRHHLDLIGAASEHLAGAPSHLVGTIDDNAYRPQTRRLRFRLRRRAWTQVAVAACLWERTVADEQPRTTQQTLSNRLLVAPIQAAGVAHGGEAVGQRFLDFARDLGKMTGVGPRLRSVMLPTMLICTCASISPRINTRPATSISMTLFDHGGAPLPMPAIRSPSTRTQAFVRRSRPVQSISAQPWISNDPIVDTSTPVPFLFRHNPPLT
jgi:hypothetical protein